MFDVTAQKYSLTIDADETLRATVGNWGVDAPDGEPVDADDLFALLGIGTRVSVYVFSPDTPVTAEAIMLLAGSNGDGYGWDISSHWDHESWARLAEAGYAERETRSAWFDGNSETYASEHRSVELYRVLSAFRAVTVEYNGYRIADGAYGIRRATTCRIVDSVLIPAGDYARAKSGDYIMGDVCSAYLGTDALGDHITNTAETLFYALVEETGFDASRAYAECDSCGARWEAEGGWHFLPSDAGFSDVPADLKPFDYDDTTGHDGNTIDCPHCSPESDDANEPTGPGRVGFSVS